MNNHQLLFSRRILPDVTLYDDYRKFLQDYYDLNKAADPSFSYRYLSMRAGVSSSAFFKRVMIGIRNLSLRSVDQTCRALRLSLKQKEYFRMLVLDNQQEISR